MLSVLVIGGGSVGLTLVGYMSNSNKIKVYLLVKTKEQKNELHKDGITIQTTSNNIKRYDKFCDFEVVNNIDDIKNLKVNIDYIFICTKTTELSLISCKISFDFIRSCIVVVQNGIDNEYSLLNNKTYRPIFRLVFIAAVERLSKTKVKVNYTSAVQYIGSIDLKATNIIDSSIIDILRSYNIIVAFSNDINKILWRKAILSCVVGPLSAILSKKMCDLFKIDNEKNFASEIIDECILVASERNIIFNSNERSEMLMFLFSQNIPHYTSMYHDLKNDSVTEIEHLNGMIVRLGKKYCIPTPYNKYIYDTIKNNTNNSMCISMMNHPSLPLVYHYSTEKMVLDKILCKNLFSKEVIYDVKLELNGLINKLIDSDTKFDKLLFLSSNKTTLGNILDKDIIEIDDKTMNEYIKYILSDEVPIRVKVTSIMNSIYDVNKNCPRIDSGQRLTNYILSRNTEDSTNWLQTRQSFIIHQREHNIKDIPDHLLWAPIYLYPKFSNKIKIHNMLDRNIPTTKIHLNILNEPLTEREINLLEPNGEFIKVHTGLSIYSIIRNSLDTTSNCFFSGISGHQLLLIELAMVLDMNWKLITIAGIIEMLNIHHSLDELFEPMLEMGLLDIDINNKKGIINTLLNYK